MKNEIEKVAQRSTLGVKTLVASVFSALLLISSCGQKNRLPIEIGPTPDYSEYYKAPAGSDLPEVPREFRAAWVATVANIDWPSEPGLSTEQQKAEARAILDKAVESNMNAIVFQVRPQADALYDSNLEPWSYYLTGKMGQAPSPYYDPLEFWVRESHLRGLELHCWFNPYRANHPSNKSGLSDDSIVKTRPGLAKQLGDNGYYWLDPAKKEVQDHSIAVVMDVVTRYDIDGVHFDDYFYPYPSYNDGEDFPDADTYAEYQAAGGELSLADFRRKGVDDFIERLYLEIKVSKPHVKLGISPFGIARPGKPREIQGFDQYATLYADAEKWLKEGWVDYYTPQLYWPINQIPQSYALLLGWWAANNPKERNLWPGLYTSKYGSKSNDAYDVEEIVSQILLARGIDGASGHVHFSMKALQNNDELMDRLMETVYTEQAIIPASPWISTTRPPKPKILPSVEWDQNRIAINWSYTGRESIQSWVVQIKRGNSWEHMVIPGLQRSVTVPLVEKSVVTTSSNQGLDTEEKVVEGDPISIVAVSGVSRAGIQGYYDIEEIDRD